MRKGCSEPPVASATAAADAAVGAAAGRQLPPQGEQAPRASRWLVAATSTATRAVEQITSCGVAIFVLIWIYRGRPLTTCTRGYT